MGIIMTSAPILGGSWQTLAKGSGAIDIAGIGAGYKFLRLQILGTMNAGQNKLSLRFNNDFGNNYTSSADGTANGAALTGEIVFVQSSANTPLGLWIMDIVNIATSNKLVTCEGAFFDASPSISQHSYAGVWANSTDEINRILVHATPVTPVTWVLYGAAQL